MDLKSLMETFRAVTDWRTWGAGLAMLGILIFLCLRDTLANRKPLLTGRGTVVGRDLAVAHVRTGMFGRDGHDHRLTFRLSDGEEMTLYVSEHAYLTLNPGAAGHLTWRGDTLLQFLPE